MAMRQKKWQAAWKLRGLAGAGARKSAARVTTCSPALDRAHHGRSKRSMTDEGGVRTLKNKATARHSTGESPKCLTIVSLWRTVPEKVQGDLVPSQR
ncbi:hypothetical protein E4U27_000518 [Claviceps purpurea]|nr:hypothetical protein E4U27_000518 [Claviceps purpurea]